MKNITLGILGGGQLGRMSAMAAARLGIKTIIYTPEENSPASLVAYKTILADYLDEISLEHFATQVDFISYEFENIPVKTVEFLKKLKPVYPDSTLLEVSQDRIKEKTYLNSINIPTAKWAAPTSTGDILSTLDEWKSDEAIIKTVRFGYDGKGQARISRDTNFDTLWSDFNGQTLIMEEIIDFSYEISVIVARDIQGKMVVYGPMLNEHENHILSKTTVPAPMDDKTANSALSMAERLAQQINLIGLLTLELFVTKDGNILANEIAPRTHNSGHWTIDACTCSQFENHVRAVCALPVAPIGRHSDAIMLNLIGKDIEQVQDHIALESACIHLYGKSEIRDGRKMGHITILK
ncbi:MAG: 5-(carboxyamino)imidazole ribonucleotide synthase [Micavibrio sp.]|nr:5-(carboxyamino)imidazole ribonucleotide synthase [Micavibrio sp.]